MVSVWILQIFGMMLTLVVLQVMQRRAFMRGLKGTPMHDNWFKILKLIFLVCWLGPPILWFDRMLGLVIPIGSLFLLIYGYTFVDLSEVYGGRLWTPLRQSKMATSLAKYFPIQVIRKTPRLDPVQRYIFAAHPHGILPFGFMSGMLQPGPHGFADLFPEVPDLRFLVSSFNFYVPFFRDFLLSIGAIDASRFSASRTLNLGSSILLFPGGASEALYCSPKNDVLLLSKRTGFIKLALEFGADIVPVYTFNENNAYEQFNADSPVIQSIKGWFQSLTGMSLPLLCHFLPRRAPMTTVYGEPIKMPKISGASDAVAYKYLQIYMESLKALYNAHMKQYNVPNDKPELTVL